jgi:hypothetical protein
MKKTLKTILCTILTMVLLLPAVYAAEVSEDGSADRASTAASESSSADAASAAETLQAQKENAEKKDILILFTSDVHCGIDKGFGYAGLQQVRQTLEAQGYETILIDNGDAVQGEPIGMLSKGEALIIISTSRSTDNIKLSLNANEASGAKCTSSPARNLFAKSEFNEHLFAIRPSVCHNHQRIQAKTKLTPLELRCQFVA